MKSLAKKVLNKLLQQKIKISIAESCTGGLLSSKITSLKGSSKVFSLGVVVILTSQK